MRTLIVNGEPGMRAQLHRLCANRPDLKVIAEAASGLQAIDALEEGAADLLLVDSRLNAAADQAITERPSEFESLCPPQIIGERASRIYFLDLRNVEYVASAGNYVTTHVGGDQYLTRATLKSMAEMLSPLGFVQIERSVLINLRQVAHVERRDRGQFCFVTRTGQRLVSSRERGAGVRALLLGAMTPHRR